MASAFPTDDFDDEIIKFIDSEKKENTVLVTKSHISHLSKWLLEMKQEQNPIYELAPEILNKYLCEFFMTLKKRMGQIMNQEQSALSMPHSRGIFVITYTPSALCQIRLFSA